MVLDGTNTQGIGQAKRSSSKGIIFQTTIKICSFMSNVFGVLAAKIHPALRCLQFPLNISASALLGSWLRFFSCHRNPDWELNAPGARQDECWPGVYGKGRRKAFQPLLS